MTTHAQPSPHDAEGMVRDPASESCAASLIEPNIHEWVAAQVDAVRARDGQESRALGSDATLDLLAIVMYGKKVPAVAQAFEDIYKSGAVVIGSDVNPAAAARDRASNLPIRYHINERMETLLTACRAGHFVDLQVQ